MWEHTEILYAGLYLEKNVALLFFLGGVGGCGFMSKSKAMDMSRQSVKINHFFPWQGCLSLNLYSVHKLSLVTLESAQTFVHFGYIPKFCMLAYI